MTRLLTVALLLAVAAGLAYYSRGQEAGCQQGYDLAEIQAVNQLAVTLVNKSVATSKNLQQRQAEAYSKVYGLTQESDMQPIDWKGHE